MSDTCQCVTLVKRTPIPGPTTGRMHTCQNCGLEWRVEPWGKVLAAAPRPLEAGMREPTLTFDGENYDCSACGRRGVALCEHWQKFCERIYAGFSISRSPAALSQPLAAPDVTKLAPAQD
jgi:hypothetical protein